MNRDGRREVFTSDKPDSDSGLVSPTCFRALFSEQAASKFALDITFAKAITLPSFWVKMTALTTRFYQDLRREGARES